MEIEEIQATWSKLSSELEKQRKLTNKIIMEMTQQRYSNKFKTISTIETIGAVICLFTCIYILVNIDKLDTWYLLACGIFTVAFLLAMPVMVLRFLHKIKNIDILKNSYRDTVVTYARAKKNLLMIQQLGIYASFVLMFSTAAVFSKIWSNVDFFMIERAGWLYGSIIIATIVVIFFARWGYRCYVNITSSAEGILKELDN